MSSTRRKVASARSAETSAMATLAPCAAKSSAIASPIPGSPPPGVVPAPVTNARFPASRPPGVDAAPPRRVPRVDGRVAHAASLASGGGAGKMSASSPSSAVQWPMSARRLGARSDTTGWARHASCTPGTMTSGRTEWWASACGTLPITNSAKPPCPRRPTTTRSASSTSATRSSAAAGRPSTSSVR